MAEDEVEQRDSSAVLLASVETRPLTDCWRRICSSNVSDYQQLKHIQSKFKETAAQTNQEATKHCYKKHLLLLVNFNKQKSSTNCTGKARVNLKTYKKFNYGMQISWLYRSPAIHLSRWWLNAATELHQLGGRFLRRLIGSCQETLFATHHRLF